MRISFVSLAAVCALLVAAAGCQSVVPHPPRYEHFVSAYKASAAAGKTAIPYAEMRLFEALQFTDKDLSVLQASGDATIMLGGGIARSDHPTGSAMLRTASQNETTAAVAATWLIREEINNQESPFQREEHKKQLHGLVEKLQSDVPGNALSYYLMASIQTPTSGDEESINFIRTGNSKRFDGYAKESFLAVTKAAESVGYSRYAAYNYALGSVGPISVYSTLRRCCSDLLRGEHSADARIECLAMGHNIETSSPTLLEKLLALVIETDALRESGDPKDQEMITAVKQRRADLQKLAGMDMPPIREDLVGEYFRTLFDEGEESAIRFAASKK